MPQLLAGGAADFGIGSNGFIPLNMLREGAPIKAVMAVFQKDPQVLITHPRDDVRSLAADEGQADHDRGCLDRRLLAVAESEIRLRAIRRSANTRSTSRRSSSIRKRSRKDISRREPYTIEQQGHFKPQVFLLADNGYPGYANMVVVPRQMDRRIRRLCRRSSMRRAKAGRTTSSATPRRQMRSSRRDNPDMTDGLIAQAIAKMKSYGIVASGDAATMGIGAMTDARWKTFFDTMSSEGLYTNRCPIGTRMISGS